MGYILQNVKFFIQQQLYYKEQKIERNRADFEDKILKALQKIGKPSVEPLISLLNDKQDWIPIDTKRHIVNTLQEITGDDFSKYLT